MAGQTVQVLLTISTTMPSAGDLGYLVHKHPDRAQEFSLPVGTAHVVWPEVSAARSTVALLLEVDPIALVRGRKDDSFSLAQYVNDRPYATSSMFAVALGNVFRTALAGICKARPDLAAQAIPLELHLPAVPSRGGDDLIPRLFEPLGWQVEATAIPLDPTVPAWGDSPYVDLRLQGTLRLADALTHLYVLLPVLDDGKHYWVGTDEVDKLMRFGADWLPEHPERELITRRYLRHQRSLILSATERLTEADGIPLETDEAPARPLAAVRAEAVIAALHAERATSVVDLGCGEGALLRELLADASFTRLLGVDVSHRALEKAAVRLGLDRLPDTVRARIELAQSSVTYRDDRLAGFDAVVLMEVIEHVDPARLPALERTVLGYAHPTTVVVTTPNAEHNALYPSLATGAMRHPDHRFEWTRAQYATWAETAAATYGYTVRFLPVGVEDPVLGPPTQMAVFRRSS